MLKLKNIGNAVMLLLSITLAACSAKDEFRINGKVLHGGEIKKVMLYEGETLIDSAFLDDKAEFRFRRSAIEPRFYTLELGQEYYFLAAKNGDVIDFEVDLTKDPRGYKVSGSDLSEKLRAFSLVQHNYMKEAAAISREFDEAVRENPEQEAEIRAELLEKYQAVMDKGSQSVLEFAEKNKDNLAGFFAMISLDPARYEQEMIAYADEARSIFPNNSSVQAFANHMAELKPLSVGNKAPDFESINVQGDTVKLSDFRGEYLLLDFWASWCGPCRQENPNIVKQYHTYKDRGFNVLGVSLDDSREAWLKGIREDKLTWTHVSDLQRWNSQAAQLYKINAIPASFLLGPDGTILAKNLRGSALEDFLQEHLPE